MDKSKYIPITSTESTEYPGYYNCVEYPHIVVSRSGHGIRINGDINKHTGKVHGN